MYAALLLFTLFFLSAAKVAWENHKIDRLARTRAEWFNR